MAKTTLLSLLYPLFLAAFLLNCHCNAEERKVHVVYMGSHGMKSGVSVKSIHHNVLADVFGSSSLAKESLLHSYGRSFNGFVAKLSEEEAAKIRGMEGVASVFPSMKHQLHTTRSWDFMGFPQSRPIGSFEGDVIIGLLDTGIWPENPSFSDEGFGPPPVKWKGTCQGANNFTCNNKVIGARFYDIENGHSPEYDILSPRDNYGHGSHTASTAAGREVKNVSYYGIADGVARGGVPSARISVYKVCWAQGCSDSDILAAFDDAIADGVDILSVSLGTIWPLQYYREPIAIGSFHAMKAGILTSCSAGNSGPYRRQVENYAPWELTVAASTIDRSFITKVVLGNGQTFLGTSLNSFEFNGTSFPLLYAGDVGNVTFGVNAELARLCIGGTLSSIKAKGGIVLCDQVREGSVAIFSQAVGLIMPTYDDDGIALAFPVPATLISIEDHDKLMDYIRITETPTATILSTEVWEDVMAPKVVSFSSRGPSPITPNILKPDLTAPGANILAAWSPLSYASVSEYDQRHVDYYVISGTSMSCPHAAGAAAYVKAAHPTWSPTAIKSALMTTATIMDPRKNEDAEFSYGSGHINPLKAVDPGLVYDATAADYVDLLCKEGYNTTYLRIVTGDNSTCPSNINPGNAWHFNYPSYSIALLDGEQIMATFPRTVTNVGSPNSTYTVKVTMPSPFTVIVEPSVLRFTEIGEKKSFAVKVSGSPIEQVPIVSGDLVWTDGRHVVRSPIVAFNNIPSIWAAFPDDYPQNGDSGSLEGFPINRNNRMNDYSQKSYHSGKGSILYKNGNFRGN